MLSVPAGPQNEDSTLSLLCLGAVDNVPLRLDDVREVRDEQRTIKINGDAAGVGGEWLLPEPRYLWSGQTPYATSSVAAAAFHGASRAGAGNLTVGPSNGGAAAYTPTGGTVSSTDTGHDTLLLTVSAQEGIADLDVGHGLDVTHRLLPPRSRRKSCHMPR